MVPSINCQVLLKAMYETTLDYGIFTMDTQGKITTWNAGAERIFGYSAEEIIGKDFSVTFTQEDCLNGRPEMEMHIAEIKERAEDYQWHIRKDGSRFWATGTLCAVFDAQKKLTGFLKIFQDTTDRKLAENEMHRMAYTDLLTGVANRQFLELQAREKIASSLRSGQPMALHLIDLDGFKRINDTLGHPAGDALLQQAARRMKSVLRDNDFIARLGGDEFVVLQSGMPTTQAGAGLARKLIESFQLPFELNHREIQMGASIGLAVFPYDADDIAQLIKKADVALYRAKQEGKGRFHFFTHSLDEIIHRKEQEIGDIRHAVQRREFWLEYQPKISMEGEHLVGVEVLLRCAHPGLRHLPMEHIVDIAVECGLMKNLSYWVLTQACRQMREWKSQGLGNIKLSVNLCSQDLTSSETLDCIDMVLADTGVLPGELEIELTERQALEVELHGQGVLRALRSRGIHIALDDFGTGFSALSYLRNMPVTAVKLDKSFLVDIPENLQGCAIIKSIIDLGNALGLEVIAEGVETSEQMDFLRDNQCFAMQGYLFSKPLSAMKMTAWMAGHRHAVH